MSSKTFEEFVAKTCQRISKDGNIQRTCEEEVRQFTNSKDSFSEFAAKLAEKLNVTAEDITKAFSESWRECEPCRKPIEAVGVEKPPESPQAPEGSVSVPPPVASAEETKPTEKPKEGPIESLEKRAEELEKRAEVIAGSQEGTT